MKADGEPIVPLGAMAAPRPVERLPLAGELAPRGPPVGGRLADLDRVAGAGFVGPDHHIDTDQAAVPLAPPPPHQRPSTFAVWSGWITACSPGLLVDQWGRRRVIWRR